MDLFVFFVILGIIYMLYAALGSKWISNEEPPSNDRL